MDYHSDPTHTRQNNQTPKRLLRFARMQALVGLSRSSIYARIQQGSFPKSISLGGKAVAWLESDIEDWITSQITTAEKAKSK